MSGKQNFNENQPNTSKSIYMAHFKRRVTAVPNSKSHTKFDLTAPVQRFGFNHRATAVLNSILKLVVVDTTAAPALFILSANSILAR